MIHHCYRKKLFLTYFLRKNKYFIRKISKFSFEYIFFYFRFLRCFKIMNEIKLH